MIMKDVKQIAVKIPIDDYEFLRRAAYEQHLTVSDVVRLAVKDYRKVYEQKEQREKEREATQ